MFKPTTDDYVRVMKRAIFEIMCQDTTCNPDDFDDDHINQVLEQQGIKIIVGSDGNYAVCFNHS